MYIRSISETKAVADKATEGPPEKIIYLLLDDTVTDCTLTKWFSAYTYDRIKSQNYFLFGLNTVGENDLLPVMKAPGMKMVFVGIQKEPDHARIPFMGDFGLRYQSIVKKLFLESKDKLQKLIDFSYSFNAQNSSNMNK